MTEKIKELYKFSWSQAMSDTNGKTSIIAITGTYVTFIGGLVFLFGGVLKDSNLLTESVIMTSIGMGAIMGRKIVNGKSTLTPIDEEVKKDS